MIGGQLPAGGAPRSMPRSRREIADGHRFAEASPFPTADALETHVFAGS